MVATRKSLSTPSATSSPAPPNITANTNTSNKKVASALKKLQIDGTSALIGESRPEEEEELQTYHYRGAVYAVTPETKEEWVKGEPARWKRKRSSGSERRESFDGGVAVVTRKSVDGGVAVGRRESADGGVTVGNMVYHHDAADEKVEEEQQQPSAKRTKRSQPEDEVEMQSANGEVVEVKNMASYDGAADEEGEGEQQTSAKRARRGKPEVYYGRPKRKRSSGDASAPKSTPKKRRKSAQEEDSPIPTSRLYDMATVGGHEELSCKQAARAMAARKGYQTQMLPESRMMTPHQAMTQKIKGLFLQLVRLNELNEKMTPLYRQVAQRLTRLEEIMRQQKAEEGMAGPPATSTEGQVRSTSPESNDQADARPAAQQPILISLAQVNGRAEATPPPPSDQDQNTCTNSSSSTPNPSGNPQPRTDRHDSAASDTPSLTTATTTTSDTPPTKSSDTHPNKDYSISIPTTQPDIALPQKNKAGNPLRWSLPANLLDEGRAEAQINFSRMEGESKTARRRRVRRERKVLGGWDVRVEGGDDALFAVHEAIV
ncbi:hypothetical protein LTR37_001374 [Vermiconidia calcicola]|uniref:Uncharacterized protein n=1 Tax=Vermiconidia calcicola TaxID=1690605 RepID=A0ACC3NY95_9PEZI|nr:hypothetical protein LTR37_001374 [Vermiconidia calcicola]